MAEQQVTNEQIDIMINHFKESSLFDDTAKERAIQSLEEKRKRNTQPIFATEEEVNAIFGPLKTGANEKSDIDKLLDQILK